MAGEKIFAKIQVIVTEQGDTVPKPNPKPKPKPNPKPDSTSESKKVKSDSFTDWLARAWAVAQTVNRIAQPIVARVGTYSGSSLLQAKTQEGVSLGIQAAGFAYSLATGNLLGVGLSVGFGLYDNVNKAIDLNIQRSQQSVDLYERRVRAGASWMDRFRW